MEYIDLKLRLGLANAINTYLRLKIVVWGGVFNLKDDLNEFTILNLMKTVF